MIFVLSACGSKITDKDFYKNIDLKIVSYNNESKLSNDKFHNPQLCNTILFQTITGDTLYMVINTCKMSQSIHIDDKWFYQHKIGDTVHFDYLKKSEFFKIK